MDFRLVNSPKERDDAALHAGRFCGIRWRGCVAWRGIRYARGPRFELPVPAPEPATEINCDCFGPAPAQPKGVDDDASTVDDALFLNVYSPAADSARRPVLVWIYGGAFENGSGEKYDGSWFARERDLVVVTFNYRLGILGFGSFPSLGVPSNLGLRDQIMALQWVRDHIADFGGDPERITIAGESAGSISVSLLMVVNAARGLFQRAIMQSGSLNLVHDGDMAAELSERFMALLDGGADRLASLRAIPTARLIECQQQVIRERPGSVALAPHFDGDLLPASLEQALSTPTPTMPLLAGSNRDEIRLFELRELRAMLPRGRAPLGQLLTAQLGAQRAAEVLAAYPDSRPGNRELATDCYFGLPTRNFAERHALAGNPTWVYRLDRRGLLLGAPHSAELAYLWPLRGMSYVLARGGPLIGDRWLLAQRMRRHWAAFVRNGAPAAGWHRYEPPSRLVKSFGFRDREVSDPDAARRIAWGGHVITSGPPTRTAELMPAD